MHSNTGHERLQDDFVHFPESKYFPSRVRSVHLIYGLLAVSYLLIVILFITTAVKGSNSNDAVKANETASALAAFKSNVQALSNKADAIKSEYKTDIANLKSQVQNVSRDQNAQKSEIGSLQNSVGILISKMTDMANSMKNETPANACGNGVEAWLYYGGSCYLFMNVKSNWKDAKAMCVTKAATLVIITSEGEQNFIKSKTRNQRYWIGLHDIDKEDNWEWIDGTDYKIYLKFWSPGEPNDDRKNEDCAHVGKDGKWNDLLCTTQSFYICEKKATV